MKTLSSVLTRRDRCYLFGRRGQAMSPPQAAAAWFHLSERIEAMGDLDVPKFNDLLIAFRVSTVRARRTTGI
jgi:acyl transferase domain-containing protein